MFYLKYPLPILAGDVIHFLLVLAAADVQLLPAVRHEIAVAGEIQLRVPASRVVEAFRHIETLKRCEEVPAVGRFSLLPVEADLQGKADRKPLLEAARRYMAHGGQNALFRALVDRSDQLRQMAPEMAAFLVDYPNSGLVVDDQFLYWSTERLGPTSVGVVTHAVIYRVPGTGMTVIATKQAYASRHIDASLGITLLTDQPGGATLRYINRTVVGKLPGFLRPLVERRVLSTTRRKLDELRLRLEQPAPVEVTSR
ncbi:MAG: hypothetical protein NTV70_04905 [Acidobacteria bacterium]|nr:hypothetical protein [Acidobacteriota bacterium]